LGVKARCHTLSGTRADLGQGPQFPLGVMVAGVWEPKVAATVTLPAEHLRQRMLLCRDRLIATPELVGGARAR
jgi:translation elongation factor EF-4